MDKPEESNKNQNKPEKKKKCNSKNCKGYAIDETGFCAFCHPKNKDKKKEIGKLGGRPRKEKQGKKLTLERLKKIAPENIDDVLTKIGDLWLYIEAGEITSKQGEVILKGCEIALQAIEQKVVQEKILNNKKVAI